MTDTCYYCNDREGKWLFDNGRWCCEPNVHGCPAQRRKRKAYQKEKFKYYKTSLFKTLAKTGAVECIYCGKPAYFFKGRSSENPNEYIFTCVKRANSNCPGYKEFISKIHKDRYANNPELKVQMSKAMKECQNRPDVKEAKSIAMTILHNEECEPCKKFQENYKKSKIKRRGPNYERNKIYTENYRRKHAGEAESNSQG